MDLSKTSFDSLADEIDYLQRKLVESGVSSSSSYSTNNTLVTVSTNNDNDSDSVDSDESSCTSYTVVSVRVRKCLLLRVALSGQRADTTEPYPAPAVHWARVHTFALTNLKPARRQRLQEFLRHVNVELAKDIALTAASKNHNNNNGCCLVPAVNRTRQLVAQSAEFVRETLELIESQQKSNASASALVSAFLIDDQLADAADEVAAQLAALKVNNNDGDDDDNDNDDVKSKASRKEQKKKQRSTSPEEAAAKSKLKGADFIFKRIKWDAELDRAHIVIGYLDRLDGIKEIMFDEFKGVHEDRYGIPMHRIRYYKIRGLVVWDREQRIDLLTGCDNIAKFFIKPPSPTPVENSKSKNKRTAATAAAAASSSPVASASASKAKIAAHQQHPVPMVRDALVLQGSEWRRVELSGADRSAAADTDPSRAQSAPFVDPITLLSLNLLSRNNFAKSLAELDAASPSAYDDGDLSLRQICQSVDRMPHILSSLEANPATFVLLQECDEHEEAALRASPFIQRTYYICGAAENLQLASDAASASAAASSQPSRARSNCLVLSKLAPSHCKLLRLVDDPTSCKEAVAVWLEVRGASLRRAETLLLVDVHLTSGKWRDSLQKRTGQLEQLRAYVDAALRGQAAPPPQSADTHAAACGSSSSNTAIQHWLPTADHIVIAGDFNFDDACQTECELVDALFVRGAGFVDLCAAQPCTFDPQRNLAAALTSTKDYARRLDRILLRQQTQTQTQTHTFGQRTFELARVHLTCTRPIRVAAASQSNARVAAASLRSNAAYARITGADTLDRVAVSEPGWQERRSLMDVSGTADADAGAGACYLHASDHFGLECELRWRHSLCARNLVRRSALAILVPAHAARRLQRIRATHDAQYERWAPHINVLYPFYASIDEPNCGGGGGSLFADLHQTLAAFEPFECTLDRLSAFGEQSTVVFVEPSDARTRATMQAMYAQLAGLFATVNAGVSRQRTPIGAKWRDDMVPHLTVAQPSDRRHPPAHWLRDTMQQIRAAELHTDQGKEKSTDADDDDHDDVFARFTVDAVHWITRDDDTAPFHVRHTFPLGAKYPPIRVGLDPRDLCSDNDDNDDDKNHNGDNADSSCGGKGNVLRYMASQGLIPDERSAASQERAHQTLLNAVTSAYNAATFTESDTSSSSSSSKSTQASTHNRLIHWSSEANGHPTLITGGSLLHGLCTSDVDLCLVRTANTSNTSNNDEQMGASLAHALAQRSDLFRVARNIGDAQVPIIELGFNSDSAALGLHSGLEGADLQIHQLPGVQFELLKAIQQPSQGHQQQQLASWPLFFDNEAYMRSLGDALRGDYARLYPLSGLFENQSLKVHVSDYKDFQVLVSFVKHWAKRRQIYGKAFGFPGGIAWTLLVVNYLRRRASNDVQPHLGQLSHTCCRFAALIAGFYRFYAHYKWNEPVSLLDGVSAPAVLLKPTTTTTTSANDDTNSASGPDWHHKTPLMVLQSVYPYHNTTRNVSEATRRLISGEFARADAALSGAATPLGRCCPSATHSGVYERVCATLLLDDVDNEDNVSSSMSRSRAVFDIGWWREDELTHVATLVKAKAQAFAAFLQRYVCDQVRVYGQLFDATEQQRQQQQQNEFKCAADGDKEKKQPPNHSLFVIKLGRSDGASLEEKKVNAMEEAAQQMINAIAQLTHTPNYTMRFEYVR